MTLNGALLAVRVVRCQETASLTSCFGCQFGLPFCSPPYDTIAITPKGDPLAWLSPLLSDATHDYIDNSAAWKGLALVTSLATKEEPDPCQYGLNTY